MVGAIIGAVLCYVSYKQHFDDEPDAAYKLGVFSTGPAIRSYGWNLVTEIIGTFVLVFVDHRLRRLRRGRRGRPRRLGGLSAVPVALLVIGIGASLGGPTGYAINPARDLGPRIAHALLPIKGKGSSDWSYSWVPVVGPAHRRCARRPARPRAAEPRQLIHLLAGAAPAAPAPPSPNTENTKTRKSPMADYVLAIDQGTTSTRAIIFDHKGSVISAGQKEHEQIFPKAGWVEHDPMEIWHNTREVIGQALSPRRHHPPRHRRRRHHQPARDRGGLGQEHRQARLQRHRLAGHPHAVDRRPPRRRRRRRALQDRSSAFRWRPTSRAPRSSGSSRTSTVPARRPRPAT